MALPLTSKLYLGNCIEVLDSLPEQSVDMVFADPPYNMQLSNDLYRPNATKVAGVKDSSWDHFDSLKQYDEFSVAWLSAAKRVLKPNGTLWVIGSYHNIFRIGYLLQDLGFWILNDVIWKKSNPMPNFKGVRFTNAHETLLWVAPSAKCKHYFNYQSMKIYNDDKQMTSVWDIPLCTGNERIRINGQVAHPTQKPLQLVTRILLACTKENAVILDPFMGTGTTMVAAKTLGREYIGIEKEKNYYKIAAERIKQTLPLKPNCIQLQKEKLPRVPITALIDANLLLAGTVLFDKQNNHQAILKRDGSLLLKDNFNGSIHKSASYLVGHNINGWDFWYIKVNSINQSIDVLRQQYIKQYVL